jgi:regulator of RNase E activity RraA
VGVVIAGYTRDVDTLWDLDFPVFSKGAKPQDAYGKWQIAGFYRRGSYIFADGDGVVSFSDCLAGQVCDLAEERAKREEEIRTALLAEDPRTVRERFGRW